ncbi:Nramp family divalent metal transporter [candidate division KSB1 bacterium]|nr:Nramp family divalent metal transporter [candidate division KSB1 bacterium]
MQNRNNIINRFWRLLILIGPGFFLIGYSIGTGSVVSMASAGSRYGMSLLWALILACVFSFVMLEAYGRYTLVTGQSALFSYRKLPFLGRTTAVTTLIGLVFVEVLALAGIMGILSDLISEWLKMLTRVNVWNPLWIAIFIIIGLFIFLLKGKYSFFEKLLIVFVSIMGVSFILTMFLVIPNPVEIVKGAVPRIPHEPDVSMIISALVGTTLTAPTFVMRSIIVKEKGWTISDLKSGRRDAFFAAFFMFVISVSIMACAAGTLYVAGKPVEDAIQMVKLLEPLAGRFALSIFILGIIGAAFSSIIPISLLAPLLISDYRGVPVNMRTKMFRILCGCALLFGLIVPVFHARPVFAMIISQCFQIFVLPVVTISIIYLLNKKDLMGQYKAGFWLNCGLLATLAFSLFITYQSVIGLVNYLGKVF